MPKVLLLGSNVQIYNLPIKEVSLLKEGSLPAYGYNPGDDIELLAGKVAEVGGRLEECLTWLASYLVTSELSPRIHSLTYGREKKVYQIFKKRVFRQRRAEDRDRKEQGWFMVNQILPAEGRGFHKDHLLLTDENRAALS
ncbi:MAG TPA: ATPase, partial [Desulfobulbus sp.]|nr:ATPase [Desulfobulbus sp.]